MAPNALSVDVQISLSTTTVPLEVDGPDVPLTGLNGALRRVPRGELVVPIKARRHVEWGSEVLDRLCDTEVKAERRRVRASALRQQLEVCGGVTGELASARA